MWWKAPFFPAGLFLGATIISLSRFPALRIACPFPFRPVVPSAPCFGVTLVNLHELSEGDCSLLCPRTSALPLSLLFKKWGSFTWYLTQCLYLSPRFHSLLLYAMGLLFSAANTMSASEVCVREILSSPFSRSLSPGNAKINLHHTFPDTRT